MNLINDVIFHILNKCEPINIVRLSLVNKQFYRIHSLRILWKNIIHNIDENIDWPTNKNTYYDKYILYHQLNKLNSQFRLNKSINELINLKRLDLSSNKITSIPKEIPALTNLENLYLSYNKITSIPEEISALTNLGDLYLSNNKITSIPKEIREINGLRIKN